MPEAEPKPRTIGLRIHDLAGLVVGYSLAALLVRSFRGEFDPIGLGKLTAVTISFLWIGLAISGPIVLLFDARRREPPPSHPTTHPPSRYSAQEMAWMGIGGYFIALTLFVVPARNRETPWILIILTQVIASAILGIWLSIERNRRTKSEVEDTRWTKWFAGLLLITWPVAWIALILVFL